MTMLEIVGTVILPILLGFSNVGGLGGGGLIIPICVGMFGFSTIQASALSNFVIFSGCFVRYFAFSLRTKNPDKDATIVNYDMVSIMIPVIIFGTFIGTVITSLLPEPALTIILTVLLIYTTFDCFKKAITMYKKETAAKLAKA